MFHTFIIVHLIVMVIKMKDPKNIYNLSAISGHYVGSIFFIIWINFNLLMIFNRLWAISIGVRGGKHLNLPVRPATNTAFFTSIGATFAILITKFYVINDEAVKNMMQYKNDRILSIKDRTVRTGQKLNALIYEKALKEWQETFVIGCISLTFVIHGIIFGYENDTENVIIDELHPSEILPLGWVYFVWASGIAAFSLGLIFYTIVSAIRYFRYPTIVMRVFGKQITGDTGKDFIIWWQLTRYYIENEVRLTENVLNIFLTGALIGSLIMIVLSLQSILSLNTITDIPSWTIKFIFVTLVILLSLLYLGQNATYFYNKQLKHENMLTREILRIKGKKYVDGDEKVQEVLNVIDAIVDDVEKTVIAIKMGEIKITPRIMILIRGYVGSAVVAIITILISKD